MKICLVTAFPPSLRLLNEYGFHLAQELQRHALISLTVLGDEMDEARAELDRFDVVRCWQLNRTLNQPRFLKALRELRPDVVWFNLIFSTFGNSDAPAAAFSGMTLPAITRAAGFYTHVTLHHLMEHVDLEDAAVRHPRLYRLAGAMATRIVLLANSVSVLLPAYRRTLMEKYGSENVQLRTHGILSSRPEFPDLTRRGNPEHRILLFGKWGTYKRLELILEAFPTILERVPTARLVIAGGDHPQSPGYVASVAARCRDPRVTFTGYVPEEGIPELYRTASVLVMPYTSATGASGVAHLACEYGLPIVCADIPDFRNMAEAEELAIDFFPVGKAPPMAERIFALLLAPEKLQAMAEQNFSAALRMTMPHVVRQYLRCFDYQQRRRALQSISQQRRWHPRAAFSTPLFLAAKAASRWSPWM